MAWLSTRFFSQQLGVSTSVEVLLPQPDAQGQIGMNTPERLDRYPALYLLHGWSDDETIWMRRTSIERYAAEHSLVVVMPRVDLSYYQDTASGMNYWSYISQELPALCESWFPIERDRRSRFAAGLSMGGYGAFRLGLACPESFSAVVSLSGALDIGYLSGIWKDDPIRQTKMKAIFGDVSSVPGSPSDLLHLLKQPRRYDTRFYQWCGTEDFLYEPNTQFRKAAEAADLPLTYTEGPGDHSWGHWDREIQGALDWLMKDTDNS